ncbi:MAG: hypothetical protein K2Q19_08350 [Rhodocyclaceae bacterium]|nr:hypothetical protein [Rhodocyclaceae bacterium]
MNRFSKAVAMSALVLSGCATTVTKDVSPSFEFAGPTGKNQIVTGEIIKTINQGLNVTWTYVLSVRLDGTEIIRGGLDPYSFAGTVVGRSDGKPALANCTAIRRSPQWSDVTCQIALDGKTVGKLTF